MSVLIGFEDARADYLAKLLMALAKENRALVILGDSLSFQTINTIQCELYREKIRFTKEGDAFIPQEGRGKFVFIFPDINASVDVHYKRLDNIRLSHQFGALPDEFASILKERSGFVLVTNIGLNYNYMNEYEEDIPQYFQWLDNLAGNSERRIDVAWRETTASHWSYSVNGYYSGELRRNLSKNEVFCSPHGEGALDVRNDLVKKVLSTTHKDKYKRVNYIPFHFATQDLWNMHTDFPPYPGGHSDCVHYCYHPMLWQPIWRSLYEIAVNNASYVFKT